MASINIAVVLNTIEELASEMVAENKDRRIHIYSTICTLLNELSAVNEANRVEDEEESNNYVTVKEKPLQVRLDARAMAGLCDESGGAMCQVLET